MSLRRTLSGWLGDRVEDSTKRRLVSMIPYDYTLEDIQARSATPEEYLHHLLALVVMRRRFFKVDSPLHHAMDVVYEWAVSKLFSNHRCVYKKNSRVQDIEDARRRVAEKSALTHARKRKREEISRVRTAIADKTRRIREIDRSAREVDRIRVRAEYYETSVRLWSDDDRVRLAGRIRGIQNASAILKMLNIVDWYLPGTLESGEIDPMEWTTQTCRHVSSALTKSMPRRFAATAQLLTLLKPEALHSPPSAIALPSGPLVGRLGPKEVSDLPTLNEREC